MTSPAGPPPIATRSRAASERGASLIELVVVGSLVVLASITAVEFTGDSVDQQFENTADVYYDDFDAPVVNGGGTVVTLAPTTTVGGGATTTTEATTTTTTTTLTGTLGSRIAEIVVVASEEKGAKWNAAFTISVTNAVGHPVPGALVTGTWLQSGLLGSPKGDPTCTTGSNGRCTVTRINLHRTTTALTWSVLGMLNVDSIGLHLVSSAVADNPLD